MRFGGAKYFFKGARSLFLFYFFLIFLGTRKFGWHCPQMSPVATGLDIWQDNEYATEYGYITTVLKREPVTDQDI